MKPTFKTIRAFTLVEILVVITIIAALAVHDRGALFPRGGQNE